MEHRILFLSRSMASEQEREPAKDDFEALGDQALRFSEFEKVYKVRHKVSKNVYAIKVEGAKAIKVNSIFTKKNIKNKRAKGIGGALNTVRDDRLKILYGSTY